jgi:hypothetical protein
MTLNDRLKAKIDPMQNSDPAWVQYVRDHIPALRESSRSIQLDGSMLNAFDYKLYHLLDEQGCSPSMHWIVAVINNIEIELGSLSLGRVSELLIPDSGFVNELYRQYRTTHKLQN